MRVDKVPKGRNKLFAAGGATEMFGKSDRTKSAYPADPQKPGRTGQHATKAAQKRRPGRAPIDEAGDMGGSRAANPRRPAA
jgi:hypothetical protein